MNPTPMIDTKSPPGRLRFATKAMTAITTPIPSEMIKAYLDVRTAINSCRQASGPAPPSQGNRRSRIRAAFAEAGSAMPPPCLIC